MTPDTFPFWAVSESSAPDGPFTRDEAFTEAAAMAAALREPVTVFTGPAITRWEPVGQVTV